MKNNLHTLTLLPCQTRLINAAEGFQLEMISGCLWLTRPDDAKDHFLTVGMSMALTQDLILIRSDKHPAALHLDPAQYRLVPLKCSSAGSRRIDVLRHWLNSGWPTL